MGNLPEGMSPVLTVLLDTIRYRTVGRNDDNDGDDDMTIVFSCRDGKQPKPNQ